MMKLANAAESKAQEGGGGADQGERSARQGGGGGMLPAARIRMNLRRLVEVDGDIEMRSSDAEGRGSSMTPPSHHCAQENLSLLLLRACGKSSSVVRHCSSSSLSAMAAGASGEALRGVCNLPTIILAAVHTGSDTHWQRYTQQQNGLAVSRWRRRQRPREEGVGGLSEEISLRRYKFDRRYT